MDVVSVGVGGEVTGAQIAQRIAEQMGIWGEPVEPPVRLALQNVSCGEEAALLEETLQEEDRLISECYDFFRSLITPGLQRQTQWQASWH